MNIIISFVTYLPLFILSFVFFLPFQNIVKKSLKKKGVHKYGIKSTIIICGLLIAIPTFHWCFNTYFYFDYVRSEKFEIITFDKNEVDLYKVTRSILSQKDDFLCKSKNEIEVIFGSDYEKGPCNNCIGYTTENPESWSFLDHEVLVFSFNDSNYVKNISVNMW